MIRLLAYTNEPLNAIALSVICKDCKDIALIGTPGYAQGAITCILTEKPDVVLLELEDELEWSLLGTISDAAPTARIVLWVRSIEPESAFYAMQCGVRGILRKTLPPDMILKCIRKVSAGEEWFEKAVRDVILSRNTVKLSARETQLIKLVSQGLNNKEISSVMNITEGTVKVSLSRLFEKVGVRDRLELSLFGLRSSKSTGTALDGVDQQESPSLSASLPVMGPRKDTQKLPARYFLRASR